MEKWFVSMKKADFTQIAEKYHISPIIARLIRNRDILGDQNIDYYLNGTNCRSARWDADEKYGYGSGDSGGKIREGEKIRVIGDYDNRRSQCDVYFENRIRKSGSFGGYGYSGSDEGWIRPQSDAH